MLYFMDVWVTVCVHVGVVCALHVCMCVMSVHVFVNVRMCVWGYFVNCEHFKVCILVFVYL